MSAHSHPQQAIHDDEGSSDSPYTVVFDDANGMREPLMPRSEQHEGQHPPLSSSRLLLFKTLYFLGGLSGATWGRYGIVYYNRVKHLSPEKIGFLQGMMPLLSFVTQPLWGWVSDTIQTRKYVYLCCKTVTTISLLCLAIPNESYPEILICVIIMSLFRSSGVLDAHTLDFLGEQHRSLYGSIRMWACFSWGLGAMVMGYITDHLGFTYNFALFAVMMLLNLTLTATCLPKRSQSEQAKYEQIQCSDDECSKDDESGRPRFEVLYRALIRWPVLLWLGQVAVIGAGMSLVDSFFFVFLQNELKGSTVLCGYTVGMTVLTEMPIFHYSNVLLPRLGHDLLFVIAMAAYTIRVWGYTFLTPQSVWLVMLLETMHGITFGCMWIASVDFSAAVAPAEWWTTVQTVLSTTMMFVGGGFGPIIGGIVFQELGARVMYRGAGTIVAAVLVLHLVLWLVFGKGHGAFLAVLEEEKQQLSETTEEDDSDEDNVHLHQ